MATALALVLALAAVDRFRLGRMAGTALLLAAGIVAGFVMAWTQVGLGAHYPIDTLGGFFVALVVVPATAWALDRLADSL
jgi:undecaprenyl-diphosphatase